MRRPSILVASRKRCERTMNFVKCFDHFGHLYLKRQKQCTHSLRVRLKPALPPLLVAPVVVMTYTMAAMGGPQRMKTTMMTTAVSTAVTMTRE